jgi:hypothetical protein
VTERKVWIWVVLAVRFGRTQWPRDLIRGSATALLQGLRVWTQPRACMSVWVLCIIKQRSLCRADHSARGFLPSVLCLSVTEEPRRIGPGPLGSRAMRKIKKIISERKASRHTLAFHPQCSAEVQERVQLYLYCASGPTWSLLGRNLPYLHSKRLLGRPWQIKS